jgi:TonB-linked SusC/RagA family outer membrane protein
MHNMKKRITTIARYFAGTIAVMLITMSAIAQNQLTGKVSDSKDGTPVSGVTVTVKGTRVSTQTNPDGSYKITAPAGATALVFTSVGFARQEKAINGATVDVSFVNSSQQLNDVVIVGYGSVKKKDLTGSVSTVSAKDFNKGSFASPEQLIAGKAAGVSVISNGGGPGTGSSIRIRGGASLNASNNPLIVIDGVPVDVDGGVKGAPSFLSTINPNDIESFTILKDASSTAIYGSRASNGVILITTKKGRKGKPVFNFSTLASASMLIKKADVLTAGQLRILTNTNPDGKAFIPSLGMANTDWQDQIYRNALGTDNNFSVSGALGNMPYRASVGYYAQDGIQKDNSLKRVAASLNLSPHFFNDHLKVDINLKGSSSNSDYAPDGLVSNALSFNPTQPIYSGNSRYGGYYQDLLSNTFTGLRNGAPNNPVGLLNQNSHTAVSQRSIGNALIDYKFHFLPDLHATLNVGYDISQGTENYYSSDSAVNSYKFSGSVSPIDGKFHGGNQSKGHETSANKLLEFYLTYGKDLKAINSRIDLVGGYAYQNFLKTVYNYRGYYLDGTPNGTGAQPLYPYDKPEYTLLSYYGRLNYAYKGRYLLTGTIRTDASSRFPANNRYGVFPSGAIAWKIKEESFLKNSSVLSDLKLRVAYGITGQQDGLSNYSSVINYFATDINSQYQFGNSFYRGYTLAGYNTNIKWEQTATSNAGIDFGFLNNRITGSADVYLKKTTDLLNQVDIPGGTNPANKYVSNVGSMENKGIELNINAQVIRTTDITLDMGFNIAYNKNKITRLTFVSDPANPGNKYNPDGTSLPGTGATLFINSVNQLRGAFYVYQQVYDAAGKPIEDMFVDRNRDGVINDKDLYQYKNADPVVFMGFNSNFSYKKWNAGFVMRASIGNYIYNNGAANNGRTSSIFTSNNTVLRNGSTDVLYTNFKGSSDKYFLSDYYVQNASFLKMDIINIGYAFGKVFNGKANLRVNANLQNVFTITKYTGVDPEIGNGVDNNFYARPRILSLGFNLGF